MSKLYIIGLFQTTTFLYKFADEREIFSDLAANLTFLVFWKTVFFFSLSTVVIVMPH